MNVPRLHWPELRSSAVGGRAHADLATAGREFGSFVLDGAIAAERAVEVLAAARAFFARPATEKKALGIEQSSHFRGYSVQHNERDWREQIHFGREEPARTSPPDYERLRGPNRWPADVAWQQLIQAYLAEVSRIGQSLVALLAATLHQPAAQLPVDDPYLLLKLIHYLPQPQRGPARAGVAPHVDFSWLTLILQDDMGGLEVQHRSGTWHPVPSGPGTLVVNLGELTQLATRGVYRAGPHRVLNPSRERSRLSLPVFVNPALDAWVGPLPILAQTPPTDDFEHVHRVLVPTADEPVHFGTAEWRRKGLNYWCTHCCG